jgi:hypothetical protein
MNDSSGLSGSRNPSYRNLCRKGTSYLSYNCPLTLCCKLPPWLRVQSTLYREDKTTWELMVESGEASLMLLPPEAISHENLPFDEEMGAYAVEARSLGSGGKVFCSEVVVRATFITPRQEEATSTAGYGFHDLATLENVVDSDGTYLESHVTSRLKVCHHV